MKILKMSLAALVLAGVSCGKAGSGTDSSAVVSEVKEHSGTAALFSADSAYSYLARQVDFGPRVPGSASHESCGRWLESELRRHGATVTVQEVTLTAFDGTPLPSRNILGQFNPEASDRTLLLAHWDTRPWADEDPVEANRKKPVPGANDGASGVAVLLEMARVLGGSGTDKGIDILFVDSEDYGTEGDDMSWALGARYFAEHPPVEGYRPSRAILLDMVGGEHAVFRREYFSQRQASDLVDAVWAAAARAGYGDRFVNEQGGAITDDHLEFLKMGIPAIDIIAFSPETGFPPTWHTLSDNMDHIDRGSLEAVGVTVLTYLGN